MDGDPGQGPPPPPNISSDNGLEGEKKNADSSVGPKKSPNSAGSSCSAGGVSLEFGSDDSEIVRAAVDTGREGESSSKQQHQGRAAPAAAVVAQKEGECGFCRAGGCV